jgi:hypothetical protein
MAAIWQWEHFRRHEGLLPYQGSHLRYATCNFCAEEPAVTLTDEIKAELARDRGRGRARASSAGFILGRGKEMSRHLKTCGKAPPEHRERAARGLSTAAKKSSEAVRTQPASSEKSRVPSLPSSAKRKRSETSAAEDVRMASVGGEKRRHDPELHAQLVAEAAAVGKVSFNFLSGPLFRSLQDFYCGGSKCVERSGLVIRPEKSRKKFIRRAYDAALVDLETQLSSLALSDSRSYTVAGGGFTTVAKNHVDGVTIGRPDSWSLTIGVIPVSPSEPHGVAIAKGWEQLILLSRMESKLSKYPAGFFAALPCSPAAFVSDDAGANARARRIASLRHPDVVFLPCFAHQASLLCGDLVARSRAATVLADAAFLTNFINASPSKWLPLLRDEQTRLNGGKGKVRALATAVVTRWTSTWLSLCSVVENKLPLQRLLHSDAGVRELTSADRHPGNVRFASVRRMRSIVWDESFWKRAEDWFVLLQPTIEASLVLQSGSCTVADVLYSYGRLYQALANTPEYDVVAAMEARFCRYEFPLLYVGMLLHPAYRALALKLVSAGAVSGMRVRMWIDGYFSRWFKWESLRAVNSTLTSLVTAHSDWSSDRSSLVTLASSFTDSPGEFWTFVRRQLGEPESRHTRDASTVGLCMVAEKLFSIVPNAADPERLFSELGRLVTKGRARLAPRQSSRLTAIAASYRARASRAGEKSDRVSKRYSDKAAAIARMRQLHRNGGVASLPGADAKSADLSTEGGPDKEDALGHVDDQDDDDDGSIGGSSRDESGEGGVDGEESSAQLSPAQHVQSLVEGLSSEEATLEMTDADITESAVADFSGYQAALRAHLDELQNSVARPDDSPPDDNAEDEAGNCIDPAEERAAREQSLALYKIGELPEENVDLPMDNALGGWRAAKVALRVLFSEGKVGKLAPMTTIG